MERKRRARINSCLGQLKTLVLQAMRKDVSSFCFWFWFRFSYEIMSLSTILQSCQDDATASHVFGSCLHANIGLVQELQFEEHETPLTLHDTHSSWHFPFLQVTTNRT